MDGETAGTIITVTTTGIITGATAAKVGRTGATGEKAEMTGAEKGMEETLIKEGERIDDLQRNGLRIIQKPDRFCFGMDAVLLSAFVTAKPGDRIMDLCTGNGVIPLLLSARTEHTKITGLEIQEESADLFLRSVELNGLKDRIRVVCGDVKDAAGDFGASSFDIITVNPPYMMADHGLLNPDHSMNIARHEILCTWQDIVEQAAKLLKPKGRMFIVHRPFRLPELLSTLCAAKLEPKRMRMVHPFMNKEPNMVLIEAVRDGRPRMQVEPPLIIYKEVGVYTEEVRELYYG